MDVNTAMLKETAAGERRVCGDAQVILTRMIRAVCGLGNAAA